MGCAGHPLPERDLGVLDITLEGLRARGFEFSEGLGGLKSDAVTREFIRRVSWELALEGSNQTRSVVNWFKGDWGWFWRVPTGGGHLGTYSKRELGQALVGSETRRSLGNLSKGALGRRSFGN